MGIFIMLGTKLQKKHHQPFRHFQCFVYISQKDTCSFCSEPALLVFEGNTWRRCNSSVCTSVLSLTEIQWALLQGAQTNSDTRACKVHSADTQYLITCSVLLTIIFQCPGSVDGPESFSGSSVLPLNFKICLLIKQQLKRTEGLKWTREMGCQRGKTQRKKN